MNSPENIAPEDFERLEAYLNDELSADERKKLEKELESDPDLGQELELLRETRLAVEAGAMKKRMEHWHESLEAKENSRNKFPWIALAASLLIIFGILTWLWIPDSSERLFAEKAQLDPGLPTPMSATDKYNFYDAMVDYKNENYHKALDKWQQQLAADPGNDTLLYYCGAANFAMEEYEEAISYYHRILKQEKPAFKAKAEWYLSLCWLKTGEEEKIHALAGKSQSDYAERIRELSRELKGS